MLRSVSKGCCSERKAVIQIFSCELGSMVVLIIPKMLSCLSLVYVCIYIYTCTSGYMHMYIYIHKHTCVYIYLKVFINVVVVKLLSHV